MLMLFPAGLTVRGGKSSSFSGSGESGQITLWMVLSGLCVRLLFLFFPGIQKHVTKIITLFERLPVLSRRTGISLFLQKALYRGVQQRVPAFYQHNPNS